MKKTIIFAVTILLSILCLFSCADGDGAPEGMQLAQGSDEIGYYFYVPEEWVVSNFGDIGAAYASKVDSSSVSFVETKVPEVSADEGISLLTRRASATAKYFKDSMAEFPLGYKSQFDGESVSFGNAEHAFKFVFDYEKSDDSQGSTEEEVKVHKFRCMQILVYFEDRFGIFTFTSHNENMSSDEKVQFEYYQDKWQAMIDNFKFVKKAADTEAPDERIEDEDGYLLSSDKTVSGISLYLPKEFKLEFSSGMIAASLPDGSNLTVSKATATGVTVNDYWNYRKSELEALFGEVTVLSRNPEDDKNTAGIPVELEGTKYAFLYEYTYNALGEKYHVYQVLAVAGSNGFVFTYTAKEANYSLHLNTIDKILKKVDF